LNNFQSSFFEDLMEVLEAPLSKFHESAMQMVENLKSLKIHQNFYVVKVVEVVQAGFIGVCEIR
jgi:hypothetical protein